MVLIMKKGTLEIGWNDLAIAKENLQYIKEHYAMYKDIEERFNKIKTKEQWFKDNNSKFWFVNDSNYCIKFKLDNGKTFQMNCFWCGYFETLHSAEIIMNKDVDNDLKINFN